MCGEWPGGGEDVLLLGSLGTWKKLGDADPLVPAIGLSLLIPACPPTELAHNIAQTGASYDGV